MPAATLMSLGCARPLPKRVSVKNQPSHFQRYSARVFGCLVQYLPLSNPSRPSSHFYSVETCVAGTLGPQLGETQVAPCNQTPALPQQRAPAPPALARCTRCRYQEAPYGDTRSVSTPTDSNSRLSCNFCALESFSQGNRRRPRLYPLPHRIHRLQGGERKERPRMRR